MNAIPHMIPTNFPDGLRLDVPDVSLAELPLASVATETSAGNGGLKRSSIRSFFSDGGSAFPVIGY